ncbi:hypothetical protein [Brevibacterium sp.]|uniref:hypothetical protein n=1 Tax=Brevibacterium sp. TaxID=1701 RepID=UPI0025B8BF5E|nr:hypothetical protein [Brevibacterium sp.]
MTVAKAKKDREDARGPRMDDLSDLTPQNLSRAARRRQAQARARATPVSPEEQAKWEAKTAAAEARKGERTNAPFIVLGVVAVLVIALFAWNALKPKEQLTVGALHAPAVAALDGGGAAYPPDSAEAVGESVKFGYLPAVELQELADGTVVLGAEPEAADGGEAAGAGEAASAPGFSQPYAQLSPEEFAEGSIPAPREDGRAGTPVTWEDAYADFAEATVFMPAVDTRAELDAVLDAAAARERLDALIVRTEDAGLARAAADAGAPALFTGDLSATTAEQLETAGFSMAAVPADREDLTAWIESGLQVWATGVSSAEQLGELAEQGVQGALTANPFELQPPEGGED